MWISRSYYGQTSSYSTVIVGVSYQIQIDSEVVCFLNENVEIVWKVVKFLNENVKVVRWLTKSTFFIWSVAFDPNLASFRAIGRWPCV
jgi:hypothetical protein